MKLAIIDLDGVVADSSARFAEAEKAKAAFIQRVIGGSSAASDIYWNTAFTPDLVQLDTLIDGADTAVRSIVFNGGYEVYFLTSRPETMREATLQWLTENNVYDKRREFTDRLIMKPASQQYVKTVVWKSGVIEVLARLFDVIEVLVVDDESAHRDAASALSLPCKLKVAASLQEAVEMIGGEK